MSRDRLKQTKYDLILVDAFTGDGIPAHLLTREALSVYMANLANGGLIIFHVSNRYYELQPLIKAVAQEMKLYGAFNIPAAQDRLQLEQVDTKCVVLAEDRSSLQPLLQTGWILLGEDDLAEMAPWTDDYINILEPLWEGIKAKYRGWSFKGLLVDYK